MGSIKTDPKKLCDVCIQNQSYMLSKVGDFIPIMKLFQQNATEFYQLLDGYYTDLPPVDILSGTSSKSFASVSLIIIWLYLSLD